MAAADGAVADSLPLATGPIVDLHDQSNQPDPLAV
jgi:hypothetical protein